MHARHFAGEAFNPAFNRKGYVCASARWTGLIASIRQDQHWDPGCAVKCCISNPDIVINLNNLAAVEMKGKPMVLWNDPLA